MCHVAKYRTIYLHVSMAKYGRNIYFGIFISLGNVTKNGTILANLKNVTKMGNIGQCY